MTLYHEIRRVGEVVLVLDDEGVLDTLEELELAHLVPCFSRISDQFQGVLGACFLVLHQVCLAFGAFTKQLDQFVAIYLDCYCGRLSLTHQQFILFL